MSVCYKHICVESVCKWEGEVGSIYTYNTERENLTWEC